MTLLTRFTRHLPPGPRRRACLALAALGVLLLFWLGAQPFAVGLFPSPWDKLAHLACYGALASLLALGLSDYPPWLPVLLVFGVGLLDEGYQAFLPGRSADLADLLTDLFAAICAVAATHVLILARTTPAAHGPCTQDPCGCRSAE